MANHLTDLADMYVAQGMNRRAATSRARNDAIADQLPVLGSGALIVNAAGADDRRHLVDRRSGGRPALPPGVSLDRVARSVAALSEWADRTRCGTTWSGAAPVEPDVPFPRCPDCLKGNDWADPAWAGTWRTGQGPDALTTMGAPVLVDVGGGAPRVALVLRTSDRPGHTQVLLTHVTTDHTDPATRWDPNCTDCHLADIPNDAITQADRLPPGKNPPISREQIHMAYEAVVEELRGNEWPDEFNWILHAHLGFHSNELTEIAHAAYAYTRDGLSDPSDPLTHSLITAAPWAVTMACARGGLNFNDDDPALPDPTRWVMRFRAALLSEPGPFDPVNALEELAKHGDTKLIDILEELWEHAPFDDPHQGDDLADRMIRIIREHDPALLSRMRWSAGHTDIRTVRGTELSRALPVAEHLPGSDDDHSWVVQIRASTAVTRAIEDRGVYPDGTFWVQIATFLFADAGHTPALIRHAGEDCFVETTDEAVAERVAAILTTVASNPAAAISAMTAAEHAGVVWENPIEDDWDDPPEPLRGGAAGHQTTDWTGFGP